MRTGLAAVAAAIAGGVAKDGGHHRHGHQAFHAARALNTTAPEPTCGCTTVYSVVVGTFSLYNPPEPTVTSTLSTTSTVLASSTTTVAIVSSSPSPSPAPAPLSSSSAAPVPTTSATPVVPFLSTCSSTGVYTVPASTITVASSTVESYTAGTITTTVTFVPGTYTRPETVTTVTETSYVIFCPFSTATPAPEPVSTEVAPSPVAPSPVAAAITSVAAVIESVAPVVESITKPKPSAQPKPETSSSSSSPPSTGGKLGSTTNEWGITYTPYSPSGDCKTASEVNADIASIAKANFDVVRVYSTDCSALENIGSACKANGMKMLLGVFISSTGIEGAQEQVTDLVKWAQWSLVDLIVVGNEAIMSGVASASDLAAFISSASSAFKSAGYTGPVTTTEPLSSWEAHHDVLCPVVDVVGANIHAFFSPITDAAGAGAFVKMELDIANKLCPGKYAINLESGWPSGGTANGLAVPGIEEQAIAIKSVKDAVGGHSVMFSFVDDPWKAPGQFGCEQKWGAFHLYE